MKTNVLIFSILLICFAFISCEKNPCKSVDCGVKGICNGANGECVCLDNYTKDADGKCTVAPVTTLPRDKYIGTYIVTEQGVGAASTSFTVTISAGVNEKNVVLSGFGNYRCGTNQELISLTGEIYNDGTVLLGGLQRYCGNDNISINTFNTTAILNNTFSANYTVWDVINSTYKKDVTATFVKQ